MGYHTSGRCISHFISSVILADLRVCVGLFTELSARLAGRPVKRDKLMNEVSWRCPASCLFFFFFLLQHLTAPQVLYRRQSRSVYTKKGIVLALLCGVSAYTFLISVNILSVCRGEKTTEIILLHAEVY